ncbi:MAG: sulfatase-like hydrolase/transferase [Blastocatellia bacterium]
MMKKTALMILSIFSLTFCGVAQSRPNVVFIYADDIGYGDVSCYSKTAPPTPNIDRLAQQGLKFTNDYAAAATCTPSRYALLTGEKAWRKEGTSILPGDAALIIEPGRKTPPEMFRRAGYKTAVVGKWHLGLGPKGGPDWKGEIKPGPNEVGFDYSYVDTRRRIALTVYVKIIASSGLIPRSGCR